VIVEDQVVADVSTDKAIVEIPSMYNGVVTKLYYAEGDVAQVHSPLFAIDAEGDGETAVIDEAGTKTEAKQEASIEPEAHVDLAPAVDNEDMTTGKVLSTPAVRRLARENALDLALVSGTGKAGRVLKEDLLRYLAKPEAQTPLTADSAAAITPKASGSMAETDRVETIRGVRKIMAERMSESVATIPHFTYVDEIDITELVALRAQLKERYAPEGIKVTMMPLFIKAMSLAIKQFPVLNSRANEAFTELTYLSSHNIGMAVDGKTGLLVPNIKGVQAMSILDVAQEVSRLTEAARSGKISPADLSGGTITMSNVGAIGGTAATPIITKPEVAIVALGKVQTLPRFDESGNVQARKIMTVSWSGDHRVIDGATMARFSNQWKEYLEVPSSMLASMV